MSKVLPDCNLTGINQKLQTPFHTAELTDALALADKVTIAPLHRIEKIPSVERLDTGKIVEVLGKMGVNTFIAESFDQILQNIEMNTTSGDVLVIMSNGGFGGIKEKIVEFIRDRV